MSPYDRRSVCSRATRARCVRCLALSQCHAGSHSRAIAQPGRVRVSAARICPGKRRRMDQRVARVAQLSADQRDIVVLFYFDDMGAADIQRFWACRTARYELSRGESDVCAASSTTTASTTYQSGRRAKVHSDFSTTAKSARAAIPVPEVPLESIRSRSRTLGNRDRLRMLVACGVIALAAIAAGALSLKLYGGIQFWFSGDRRVGLFHSLTFVDLPNVNDLHSITAKARVPGRLSGGNAGGSTSRSHHLRSNRPSDVYHNAIPQSAQQIPSALHARRRRDRQRSEPPDVE
jgi:hypothetical protein